MSSGSELAEMAPTHKVGDKVEEAYRRGSGLKRAGLGEVSDDHGG